MKTMRVTADSPVCPACAGAGQRQNVGQQPECETCHGRGRLPVEVEVPVDVVTPFVERATSVLQGVSGEMQVAAVEVFTETLNAIERGEVVIDSEGHLTLKAYQPPLLTPNPTPNPTPSE